MTNLKALNPLETLNLSGQDARSSSRTSAGTERTE